MKKYIRFAAAVLVLSMLSAALLSGCATYKETPAKLDLPEAEDIQALLDGMSKAVLAKDLSSYMQAFSESCLQRENVSRYFEYMKDKLAVSKYSQTVTKAKRIYGGTVCTVQIYCESQPEGKKNINTASRDIYFISENGTWRIADYDYYPLTSPYIVAGSDSILYDNAVSMSEELSCRFTTDTNYLQTYGDAIFVGTPYDNASILDLEERDLTGIKVTEDYPGDDRGIVQVLTNIDNHRFVIIIQGSSSQAAKDAVDYMTGYLHQNPYINPGVYFISGNKLKKADALELTTLTTLDPEKTEDRLTEVRKNIEANISMLREELQSEQDQLLRSEKNVHNPYLDDYYKAFMGSEQADNPSAAGIAAVPADFTDSRLCTWAFSLPASGDAGTVYSYSRFMEDKLLDLKQPYKEEGGIFSSPDIRIKTAGELYSYSDGNWKLAGDPYSISNFNTAMLRLLGFSQDEAFSCVLSDKIVNFINPGGSDTNTGFIGIPEAGLMRITQKLNADELERIENDGAYVDFAKSASNLATNKIHDYLSALGKVLKLKKEITRSKADSITVSSKERHNNTFVLYDTNDIYEMLKDTFLLDEDTNVYTSLEEAKSELRSVMGRLLAVKNTGFLINSASAYPGSQYDYARFAAGLANVEYPDVYAQAAVKSREVQEAAENISDSDTGAEEIIQQLLQLADSIKSDEASSDRFTYPDTVLSSKTGTPMDKALLLYGIYKNIYPDANDVYVAVGTGSAYLAYRDTDGWEYIDCSDNLKKNFIGDDIYLSFSEAQDYNSILEIGTKPDFIQ